MRINKRKIAVFLFGAAFIICGFVSIGVGIDDLYSLATARYKVSVDSRVIEVHSGSDRIKHSDIRRMSVDSTKWYTLEEMIVDGRLISHEGEYMSFPGGSIKHTLISNDGKNWTINDSNKSNLIFGTAGGILCISAGIVIIIFSRRV